MRCLLILPFMAECGVQGRKTDAIGTVTDAHKALGIDLLAVALEPGRRSAGALHASFNPLERFVFRFADLGVARRAKTWWRGRLIEAIADCHREQPIDLSFAVSMLNAPSVFVHDLWRRTGIPYIIQEHRTLYQRHHPTRESMPLDALNVLDNAAAILALTKPHADCIRRVTETPVTVAPLALPASYFMAPPTRPPQDTWTIASWTNWRDFKRLDLIIAAFIATAKTRPNVRLVIAGPVPADQLTLARAQLEGANLIGSVTFAGPLARTQIKDLAHSCDVCVVPSDHETFGLPASEALSAGTPVVVTRCGGPETFVNEGVNGFCVPKGDAEAIADALRTIMDNPNQFDRASIASDAAELFSVAALTGRLSELYRSIGRLDTQPV